MLVHLWPNRGRFMILHLPSTSHTFCSLGKEARWGCGFKNYYFSFGEVDHWLQTWKIHLEETRKTKVSWDSYFPESSFWKRQERWFRNHLHHGFSSKGWVLTGCWGLTIWSVIICRLGLSGWHQALCDLFHLLVAFGCFLPFFPFLLSFFFSCPLEWPGKGGGGSTQHSQLAWDTSQFIYLNNKHPACQESSDRGQFLNGMRQYVFWSAHPRRLKGF